MYVCMKGINCNIKDTYEVLTALEKSNLWLNHIGSEKSKFKYIENYNTNEKFKNFGKNHLKLLL